MQTPLWSNSQFLSASALNTAAQSVEASIDDSVSSLHTPGIVGQSGFTFVISGLSVTVTVATASGVLFGTGEIGHGLGTTNGSISNSYVVNFASLVPGSGSVTAYLVATYSTVQQNPYQVIGPPVGHPDYDPFFAPYTAYATTQATLALSATTTPPDNVTTVEIGRCTLNSGQVTIPAISTAYQVRAGAVLSRTQEVVAADLAAGVAIANIGWTPVQQGGGPNQTTLKVNIGQDSTGTEPTFLRYAINGVDYQYLAPTSWVNSNFVLDSTFNYYVNQVVTVGSTPNFNNIYLDYIGDYLSNRLNQSVINGSTPAFNNIYLDYLGNYLSAFVNQSVVYDSSPTFAEVVTNSISSQYFFGGNPGYAHLTSGLIIQWGQATTSNEVTVFFPIAFPTAVLSVVVSEANGTGTWAGGEPTVHASSNQSAVGFVHYTIVWTGSGWSGSTANTFNYIAIGY